MERPKPTPVMVLKAIGLSISLALVIPAAAYAGYKLMLMVIAPCMYLAASSGYGILLLYRYLRGSLLRGSNPNLMRIGIFVGSVVLALSFNCCLYFALTFFTKMMITIYQFKENEVYIALVPCLLAAFWSAVLIYDSVCFRRMWERERRETHNPSESSRLLNS